MNLFDTGSFTDLGHANGMTILETVIQNHPEVKENSWDLVWACQAEVGAATPTPQEREMVKAKWPSTESITRGMRRRNA